MSDILFTQADFARKLSEETGKPVSKQAVGYYRSTGKLVIVSGFIIKTPGSTSFSKGDAVSKREFESENIRIEKEGGTPAEGRAYQLVDYEKSLKSLSKKLDPSRKKHLAPDSENSDYSSPSDTHSSKSGAFNYSDSKARNEHYKAEMSKMECERIAGTLTDAIQVENDGYSTAAQTRDNILDVPYHVSSTVAAMTDPDEIEQYLLEELTKALGSLSDKLKREVDEEVCA